MWLALVIGNSRLHWAKFCGETLKTTWETPHIKSLAEGIGIVANHIDLSVVAPEIWIASVVPAQTDLWADYSRLHVLTLDQVPIQSTYASLGIDRALAVWGAIADVGCPVLVIDAGTALTFTGIDAQQQFVGGAILPGLGLQLRSLHQNTAALPLVKFSTLPERWAKDTPAAIASGIIYTLLAGLQSFVQVWCQEFPGGSVVMTGGDGDHLLQLWQSVDSSLVDPVRFDPHLIFKGIRAIKSPGTSHN